MSAISHPAILETIEAFGETTYMADPAQIVDLCRYLKETQGYVRLSAVTAVDWHPAEPRYEVVYHLHSLGGTNYGNPGPHHRIRLKCKVSGKEPAIDSVFSVWRGADWYEREIWDMFGIRFHNHPNHERILMPTDWEGHPLRKDYPVHGYKYSYPND